MSDETQFTDPDSNQPRAKRKPGRPPGSLKPIASPEVIALAARLRGEGLSLKVICEHLERRGVRPPGGGRWHRSTILRWQRAGYFDAPPASGKNLHDLEIGK